MKSFLLVALCGLLSTQTFALDLEQAYRIALEQDPNLRAQRAAFEAESANLGIARSAFLPTVQFNGKISQTRQDIQQNNNITPDFSSQFLQDQTTSKTAALSARQPIFRLDAIKGYQQVQSTVLLSEVRWQLAQQQQALSVAESYFNVLRNQALLRSATQEQATLARQYSMMQAKFKQGLVAKNDLREAQAQSESATANVLSGEIQVQLAQEQLSQLIGPFNSQLADVKADWQAPTLPDLGYWSDLAAKHSLQIKQAKLKVQAQADNVAVQAAAAYPQLDAFASYSYSAQSPESLINSGGQTQQYGLELNWPLFSGGRIKQSRQQASKQLEQAHLELETAERQSKIAVKKAYLQLQSDRLQIQARKLALHSAEGVAQASAASYQEGLKSMVDVLLAQRNAYAARQDYLNSVYDTLTHWIQLQAAAGKLDASSMSTLNQWLQSETAAAQH